MKALILSLFFFATLNAQNIWYVNRDAIGSNNGTSWANAWKSPSNINWNNISAGDSIYISGGTDSTTYVPSTIYGFGIAIQGAATPTWTFASGSPVVIAPAWHSGHNGDVYFVIRGNANHGSIMRVGNVSNLKITGFQFHDLRSNPVTSTMLIQLGNGDWGNVDSLIYFENNIVQNAGQSPMIYLSGCKTTFRGNFINQLMNSTPNDNDAIGISSGRGGHTLDGNIIIMRNDNEFTDAHRDAIQISNIGDATREPFHTITISNNLILEPIEGGVSWNNLIYNYGGLGAGDNRLKLYIYNNIIVGKKVNTSQGGVAVGRLNNTYPISLFLLNNTLIVKGSGGTGSTPITTWSVDTLVVKNNLVIGDISMNNMLNVSTIVRGNKWINYNFYSRPGGISGNFAVNDPLSRTWAQWRSEGLDLNSITGNSYDVSFVDKFGVEKEDYYTETGRDAGVDLSTEFPFLKYDILGNERIGNWDLGALEFGGTPPNGINVKGKVFLQGPYNTNSMSTTLNQSSLLPNSQPYNQPPWNYFGNESFSSGPNSTMVDWVLVELRNASNPSQVVERRAAVLKNNGSLLNTNGSEGVHFNNVDPGSYYIAVYHRNHLAIMSAAPVQLSSNSAVYDFTTAMNKAYGQNPMVELAQGKYGMYAGDGDADGIVNNATNPPPPTTTDYSIWLDQNGTMGYRRSDFNMNSGVTVHDVNQLLHINNLKETQVP
ncbi:MAG TPA: hypothetical protein VLH59_08020 [Ignavibacteriaceae bacterium]|nr:hypothetical protein [Ignavibacteriaceae bacterium]